MEQRQIFGRALRLALIAIVAGTLLACADASNDYFPLKPGGWWHFQTATTILDDRIEQRLLISNLGYGHDGSQRVAIQRQASGREVYFTQSSRGIEKVGIRRAVSAALTEPKAPTLILPADPSSAEPWTIQSRLRLVESRTFARQDKLRTLVLPVDLNMSIMAEDDTISVPAGRFTNCIRIEGVGMRTVRTDRGNASAEVQITHQEWYAPGVGLVKITRAETSDSPFLKPGYYLQELVQFEH